MSRATFFAMFGLVAPSLSCQVQPEVSSDDDGRGDVEMPAGFSCTGCTVLFMGRSFRKILPNTRDAVNAYESPMDPIRSRVKTSVTLSSSGNVGANVSLGYRPPEVGSVEIIADADGRAPADMLCFLEGTKASCVSIDRPGREGARIIIQAGTPHFWPADHLLVGRRADLEAGLVRATESSAVTLVVTTYRHWVDTVDALATGWDLKWLFDLAEPAPPLWIEQETGRPHGYRYGRFFLGDADKPLGAAVPAVRFDVENLSDFEHVALSALSQDAEIVLCLVGGEKDGRRPGSCFAGADDLPNHDAEVGIPRTDERYWGPDYVVVTTRKAWDARASGLSVTQDVGVHVSATYWTSCEGEFVSTARCQAPPKAED